MLVVPRLVRPRSPDPRKDRVDEGPLEAFFDRRVLVLLGDPGLGKTTSFEQAAAQEPNAIKLTVRQFTTLNVERWRDKTLYLDGLDEQRAKVKDRDVLDEIVGRLDQLGPPAVRISCRGQDWLGGTDAGGLELLYGNDTVTILELQPLDETGILSIVGPHVPDAATFVGEAEARGLRGLLENPQTLTLLVTAVSEEQGWPKTRLDLFERACQLLLRETNTDHQRAAPSGIADAVLAESTDTMAAYCLLADLEGLALERGAEGEGFPALHALGKDLETLKGAARRRVFVSSGAERVSPLHRTIAEFMAARHVAGRIRAGLPLGRALSLMTGPDDGTLSDLRGLYAWLVCLLPGHAEVLLDRDPFGALLYGDAASWTVQTRRAALGALRNLEERDPWYRSEGWSRQSAYKGLVDPELTEDFRAILEAPDYPTLKGIALVALGEGQPLPALGDTLLRFIRDEAVGVHFKTSAVDAFANCCPDRPADLKALLDEVHDGRIADEHHRLRTRLLGHLYPDPMTPKEVLAYLVPRKLADGGNYGFFLAHDLVNATPSDRLIEFADLLAERGAPEDRNTQLSWVNFTQNLLLRLIRQFGAMITAEQMHRWLGIGVTADGHQILQGRDAEEVRNFLIEHPDLVRRMIKLWLPKAIPEDMNLLGSWFRFRQRLLGVALPPGYGWDALELAATEEDWTKAEFLFSLANAVSAERVGDDGEPAIDDLFRFVGRNSRFSETLDRLMTWEVADWRWEQARHHRERTQEKARRRAETLADLSPRLPAIEAGTDLGALVFLARIWFAMFSDIDREAPPWQRLIDMVGEDLAGAAVSGFLAVLRQEDLPSPTSVAETQNDKKEWNIGFPLMAGMDASYRRDPKGLLDLPAPTIASALAVNMTRQVGDEPEWVDFVLTERPDVSAVALRDYWRVRLAAGHKLHEIHFRQGDPPPLLRVTQTIACDLLSEFPAMPGETLSALLLLALPENPVRLLALARENHRNDSLAEPNRLFWLHALFILKPDEASRQLDALVQPTSEAAWTLFKFTYFNDTWDLLTRRQKLLAVRLLLLGFKNVPMTVGVRTVGDRDPEEVARILRDRIGGLARDPSPEMTTGLAALRDDPILSEWRNDLAHAHATQLRVRRDAEFRYTTLPQVIATLAGGPPANHADLRALAVAVLDDLARDIRHRGDDGYKAFWNTDAKGHPTSPKVEDPCRDILMGRLADRLAPLGIACTPEGHYAEDNRADIDIRHSLMKLPAEIKREHHREVWSAAEGQLLQRYSRDPETGGLGIYVVLWFGEKKMPPCPSNGLRPKTPNQMAEWIAASLSPELRPRIVVRVIDVSRPAKKDRR